MFTGIIQAIGKIRQVTRHASDSTLVVDAGSLDLATTNIGDSIAVNGVCLTVTSMSNSEFSADASHETLAHSSLGNLIPGSPVNLEKALTLSTPLGGHLVSGHVDALGEILERTPDGRSVRFIVRIPSSLCRYVAPKGSITIDGISLTVNSVNNDTFTLNIIPQTLAETTLLQAMPGTQVNIEVDLIARYLERLMTAADTQTGSESDSITFEKLAQYGFLTNSRTTR